MKLNNKIFFHHFLLGDALSNVALESIVSLIAFENNEKLRKGISLMKRKFI